MTSGEMQEYYTHSFLEGNSLHVQIQSFDSETLHYEWAHKCRFCERELRKVYFVIVVSWDIAHIRGNPEWQLLQAQRDHSSVLNIAVNLFYQDTLKQCKSCFKS